MAFQPVGLHSCVDLSPHPDYWWLSELGFAVQYFFSAPRYEDSLGYLPRQWVSVRPDNTDIIVRLVTRVALLLMIKHEGVRFPLLELVLMLHSSRE